MRDPLAEFLGATEGGMLDYTYLDAVKLAGHSCPTVAGAYLATHDALRRLYGDEAPERGAIRVELRGEASEGTVGVVASVVKLITGAAGEEGFKGIAGRFVRRDLLAFGAPIDRALRFTRLDTGQSVDADLPAAPPMPVAEREALRAALEPASSHAEREAFARAWQQRVGALLS